MRVRRSVMATLVEAPARQTHSCQESPDARVRCPHFKLRQSPNSAVEWGVERADRTPFQFDEKESRRLNDTLVETRLELQSAHDALLRAYGLMRDGSGPGPSKEEINRVAEAGLRAMLRCLRIPRILRTCRKQHSTESTSGMHCCGNEAFGSEPQHLDRRVAGRAATG